MKGVEEEKNQRKYPVLLLDADIYGKPQGLWKIPLEIQGISTTKHSQKNDIPGQIQTIQDAHSSPPSVQFAFC